MVKKLIFLTLTSLEFKLHPIPPKYAKVKPELQTVRLVTV